jgi:hypothetical protein
MAKKFCKACNHRCHCVGHGYYVNVDKCDTCICERCSCETLILGAPAKKSWWEKIKGWLF